MLHSKNIECILVYIEIHGGKHYVYNFYIILRHYFFTKEMIKFPDFAKCQILIKIANFREICDHHLLKSGGCTLTKREV